MNRDEGFPRRGRRDNSGHAAGGGYVTRGERVRKGAQLGGARVGREEEARVVLVGDGGAVPVANVRRFRMR